MRTVKIGIIGLGTIGGGVVRLIQDKGGILAQRLGFGLTLVKAADTDTSLGTALGLSAPVLTSSAEAIIDDPAIDVVVELIGGIEPAHSFIQRSLAAGKHVVTANKALLAKHGPELFALAKSNNVALRCDASVAGGIPILTVLDTCHASNMVTSIYGIINGTTNYILTRMAKLNDGLADALKIAQDKGFAEADPTLDMNGQDAAHKLTVLATLIYGQAIGHRNVYCEGIENVSTTDIHHARELGYVLKLLAIAKYLPSREGGGQPQLQLRVHPTLVPTESPLASVRDEYNAIFLHGDEVGNQMFYGKGAGRRPTASAVMADVLMIGRNLLPAQVYYREQAFPIMPIEQLLTQYYLRLSTVDRPGVLGTICTKLGDHNISILSCLQQEHQETDDYVHIIIMTHQARESDIRNALLELDQLDIIKQPTRFIRIERV